MYMYIHMCFFFSPSLYFCFTFSYYFPLYINIYICAHRML